MVKVRTPRTRAARRAVGRLVQLSRERQARDLERARARDRAFPYVWDEKAANHAVEFFERFLHHHKGEWAGQPFKLEPWQRDEIIRPLFGWKRADGTRRFRQVYIEVPKKNGKSTLAAGIQLYLLLADDEEGAECYSYATKRDQAKIVFDVAVAMLRRSPDLRPLVSLYRGNIADTETGSKFEPLGSDADTLDGLNPHGLSADELHAYKDREGLNTLETGMAARRQPITVYTTTAGVYNPTKPGWELHDYAIKVLERIFDDDALLVYIAAADKDDDWRKPATWKKANPNYGISVKPDYLKRECEKAQKTPSLQNSYRRFHTNHWPEQTDRWLDIEKWRACPASLSDAELYGVPCWAGLDLSSKLDLSALVLMFPLDAGFFDLRAWFFCPEERIQERSKKDLVPYDAWVRDGWLIATPGEVVDYDLIRAAISGPEAFPTKEADVRARLLALKLPVIGIGNRYSLQEIAFDPWNATQFATQLEGDGFTMVELRPSFGHLSEASKELERLIVAGLLRHPRHPVLDWMVSNVAIVEDHQRNIMPSKKISIGRIDGVSASVNALARAMTGEGGGGPSVYEERGIVFV